jgi:hypothetical protein
MNKFLGFGFAFVGSLSIASSALAGGMQPHKPMGFGQSNSNTTVQQASNNSTISNPATLVNVPISVPIGGSNWASTGSAGAGANASAGGGSGPKDCGCHGKPASAPGVANASANATSGSVGQAGNPATSTVYASPVLTQYGNTVTQGNSLSNGTLQSNH